VDASWQKLEEHAALMQWVWVGPIIPVNDTTTTEVNTTTQACNNNTKANKSLLEMDIFPS
jgi:hypothetical protein